MSEVLPTTNHAREALPAQYFHISECDCKVHEDPLLNVRDPRCVKWSTSINGYLAKHVAVVADALNVAADLKAERDSALARLGEIAALHGRYFDLDGKPGIDDTDPEPEDVWRYDRDMRPLLADSAGVDEREATA